MWEEIAEATKPESGTSPDSPSRNVYRFPVPGGWLYIAAYYGVSNMVFVPHPTAQGEKVTPVRDVFKEGWDSGYNEAMIEAKNSKVARVTEHTASGDNYSDDTKHRDELGAAYARGFREGFEVGRKK